MKKGQIKDAYEHKKDKWKEIREARTMKNHVLQDLIRENGDEEKSTYVSGRI